MSLANSTLSQPMELNGVEEPKKSPNQNATTDISAIRTPFVSNVLIIVLLTVVTLILIASCIFCYNCFLRRKKFQRRKTLGEEPNAPSRQELQDVFDFQRRAMIGSQKKPAHLDFTIFQSESSSFRASLSRWASIKNLPALHSSEQCALKNEKHPSNYATTPRSVFPTLSRKWSESSARRIEHLRTKLVARFPSSSSHSTSDISVFFSASSRNSEWGECSQLSSDDERESKSDIEAGKTKSKSGSFAKRVPSIVIEFVK